MKRKDFLKLSGLAGVAAAVPAAANIVSKTGEKIETGGGGACTLIPTETAGPFPLDLTANTTYFRQNIAEDRTGVPLNVKLKIIGSSNCLPMQNVRVNIWHCDKNGLYSGYSQQNNQGQAGKTYLRGYQMTDANGIVEFQTIFPGWYSGRICHIHFQCYVSSVYAAISQLTFPLAAKNALYAASPTLYTKGADPLTFATDNIFSDGYSYQLATLTANSAGGYDTYLEVTIQGSGISGLAEAEPETGGQFKLGQNFPNPYLAETTVPFKLLNAADVVRLEIWDLSGKQVAVLEQKDLSAGEQQFKVNLAVLGLLPRNYVYQLEVSNRFGTFRQCKVMTAG